jgi:hypothetical protein
MATVTAPTLSAAHPPVSAPAGPCPDSAFDSRPVRLAQFFPVSSTAEPLFRDWMAGHRDVLFGWTMGRAQHPMARRSLAETAVAIQRLRGAAEFGAWLYGTAVHIAHAEAANGGLPELALAGLAPELRAVLRLVSRGGLRPEEATALQAQRLGFVRCRLLQTRLQR